MIHVELANKSDAFRAYLPFVQQGAVLVESDQHLKLQDEVKITIFFKELNEAIKCDGKVVLVTSRNLQGEIKFGIQFLGSGGYKANNLIKKYLAGILND